jgi:RNA polymerase sigma factor (sigma-70 family)
LQDAYDQVPLIAKLQARRPEAAHPFKLKIPEKSLLQLGIYLASEIWEWDQETGHPKKEPKYFPTGDDLLIRYIKTLALRSMDRHSTYAAVGIGCLLFTYQPHQVSSLAEDIFDSDNIRRVKSWMYAQIEKRFRSANGLTHENEQVAFEVPDDRQRELIHLCLSNFAPWCSCRTDITQTPATSLLETYFDKDSDKSEWERVHALFDPTCGGFSRLVREYNTNYPRGNDMRLEDPDEKLRAPKFANEPHKPRGNGGDGGPSDGGDRYNPTPLTEHEIASVRHAFERNQQRRANYESGQLRVYVDGEEIATLTSDSTAESFTIPRTVTSIQVFGEDSEGALLLAVFPLGYLELAGDASGSELSVPYAGKKAVNLSISPLSKQADDSLEALVHLELIKQFDQHNIGVARSRAVSRKFPERRDSGGSSEAVGNATWPKREDRPLRKSPAYSTGWSTVGASLVAQHRAFWAKACEEFMPRLTAHALRLENGRVYDAEDLVQATACRALTYVTNPEEIRNPCGYLLSIMRRIWFDKWRNSDAANMTSLDELQSADALKSHPSVEPNVLEILENRELVQKLTGRQGSLEPREKLLLQFYLEGYKAKEIAEKLNEDVRVVKDDLNRVKSKVRSRLRGLKEVDPEVAKTASLTDREREIIALIGEGLKNKQIADRLYISETTVRHHLISVFNKLAVSDRLELIIYAFRHRLANVLH